MIFRKGANTEHRILRCATLLFEAGGSGHMTMRRIAYAAGVTPGAIYRYYTSKEELLEAVRDLVARRAVSVVRKTAHPDPDRYLSRALRVCARLALRRPHAFASLLTHPRNGPAHELFEPVVRALRPSEPPDLVAQSCLQLAAGISGIVSARVAGAIPTDWAMRERLYALGRDFAGGFRMRRLRADSAFLVPS